MAKYSSARQRNLKVGIVSYTDNEQVLEVTGNVGIKTSNTQDYELYVVGDANISGIVSATAFYGDGANLANTGSTLSTATGTQRVVLTSLTSGTMVTSSTDGDLTFNASNNLLSTPNIAISGGISTDGIDTGGPQYILRSVGDGTWEWAQVPGIFSVNNILNGFIVQEEGVVVGTAGSITAIDFRGKNITAFANPQPNGIATVTISDTPTFDSLTVTGDSSLGFTTITSDLYVAGVSTFAGTITAIDANFSGIITSSTFVGDLLGVANYANNAGISTYAGTAGVSTYSGLAGVSTSVIGGIASVTQLNVSGISTLGFFTDDQNITSSLTLPTNTTFYTVHKNINVATGSIITVGSGSTIILDRFNNLDDVKVNSLASAGVVTATSGFFDNVIGNVTGNLTGEVNAIAFDTNPSGVIVTGIVTATDFNSASDINLKENIGRIDNPIEKVLKLEGVNFSWKSDGKKSMGVIAQEVEKVLPEIVYGTDTKTVNYNGLIGLLIECVKKQQEEIDELKRKVN